ncbi:tumor necrosis factor-activated receptor [Desmophyllum pertusum]|uniref:Tumor necrosis factor-activated receptor n=1 Tax=Desmophyllum pertusum TaxID=174260 RepID=A0A9W9YGQ6_9CNID|nr:tumor necrosis factor-activated receptor [Desmophyllum pertusum]
MFGKCQDIGLLVGFITIIASSLAAVHDDCIKFKNQFWNGTQCVPCSGCPRGFGVKSKCSAKQDTECQPCWLGFDYSNTTGFEECIPCDKYSNCLEGNANKIKNCTMFSSHICDGCADGNFFYSGYGMNGGCIACSSPCTIFQDETITCSTEHDRTCTVKGTILQVIHQRALRKRFPTVLIILVDFGGTEQPVDPALAIGATPPPDKTPTVKSPILWGIICVAGLVVAITVFLVVRYRRGKGRKPKDDSNVHDDSDVHAGTVNNQQQRIPLLKSKCCIR